MDSGLSRHAIDRLVSAGHWTAVARGLYHVRGEPTRWITQAWAGVLLGGRGSRLGGTTAGFLHRLVDEPPRKITVLTPESVHIVSKANWQFRREDPGVRFSSVGSPARLQIEDTVLDLCAEDPDRLIHWLTRAGQSRRTSSARLLAAAERRSRLPRRDLLQEMLRDVAEGAESPLEIRYLRDVERAHRLPRGRRQTPSNAGPYRRDVLYRDFDLLVELDGSLGHRGVGAFRDMERDNAHLVAGQATLRYGWFDVTQHPCQAALQIATVLRRLGWSGELRRCPRCAS